MKSLREASKIRRGQMEIEQRQLLQEKLEKAQRLEQSKVEKKEKLTDNIQMWGLWQSEEEVDSALKRVKTKTDKVKALKCQPNFRKKVLRQKTADKSVYKVSKREGNKTKPLTVEELTKNVKTLIRNVFNSTGVSSDRNHDDGQPALIVGQKVSHALHENDVLTW